jgi:hypothetical protein
MKRYLYGLGTYQDLFDDYLSRVHSGPSGIFNDLFYLLYNIYNCNSLHSFYEARDLAELLGGDDLHAALASSPNGLSFVINGEDLPDDNAYKDSLADSFMDASLDYLRRLEMARLWRSVVFSEDLDLYPIEPHELRSRHDKFPKEFVEKCREHFRSDKKPINDIEPFTQESVERVPLKFTYTDIRDFTWALDFLSLADLLQSRQPIVNPLTRETLTISSIQKLKDLIFLCMELTKDLHHQVNQST